MPSTPPINRRELRKNGLFSEDRFFQLLSERCNYIDKATAKIFYMALVKLIVSELRVNGVIRLPHVGDFALVKQKPKSVLVGKTRKRLDSVYSLKFYALDAIRIYFSKLSNSFEGSSKMDPREKILNKDI